MVVYVIGENGNPLMPCSPCKARHLIKQRRAVGYRKGSLFVIELKFSVTEYKQDITLGIDTGYKVVGISASTEDKVLFEAKYKLRNDITDSLTSRRELRRTRRNRKTRYRKARFNNRIYSKHKGWLAPSVETKILEHLNIIKYVHGILPISKNISEIAAFDIQKIKNPDIQGEEYQQGEQLGFENVKEYVRWRDNCTCQHCKGKSKDKRLEVHHINQRKDGGSDRPENLITLCHTCHQALHQGEFSIKKPKGFKAETFMGVMRWAFYERLKAEYENVELTFGYITKHTRTENGLEKDHHIDARCIANHPKAKPDEVYIISKPRAHNRQLHKLKILKSGVRKSNQAPRKVFGYALNDTVKYNGVECIVHGRRSSGSFDIRKSDGEIVNAGLSYKKLKLVEHVKTYLIYKEDGQFLSHVSFLAQIL